MSAYTKSHVSGDGDGGERVLQLGGGSGDVVFGDGVAHPDVALGAERAVCVCVCE